MALIFCPKCNNKISYKATCCPKCGYDIKKKNINNFKFKLNNKTYIVFEIIMLFVGFLYIYNVFKEFDNSKQENGPINKFKSYTSNYMGISFNYPNNYNITTDDNGLIYVSENLKNNQAIFPYILIGRYDNYSSPSYFLNNLTTHMKKEYGSNFKLTTELSVENIEGKKVYVIGYNYIINNR